MIQRRQGKGKETKNYQRNEVTCKPIEVENQILEKEVGQIFQKDGLYRYFDEIDDFDYTKIISAKLLPDEAIFVISKNTVYIIEKKTQSGGGSVDEKLQTCDFKIKNSIRNYFHL